MKLYSFFPSEILTKHYKSRPLPLNADTAFPHSEMVPLRSWDVGWKMNLMTKTLIIWA